MTSYLMNKGAEVFQAIALARHNKRGISLSHEEVGLLTAYLHYQLGELLLPENPCMGDTETEAAIAESHREPNERVRGLALDLGIPPLGESLPEPASNDYQPTQRQREVYALVKASEAQGVSIHELGVYQEDCRVLSEHGFLRRVAFPGVYRYYYVDETTKPLPPLILPDDLRSIRASERDSLFALVLPTLEHDKQVDLMNRISATFTLTEIEALPATLKAYRLSIRDQVADMDEQ